MAEASHPVRGAKWEAAEVAHREALSALAAYRRALLEAGAIPNSLVLSALDEASRVLDNARP